MQRLANGRGTGGFLPQGPLLGAGGTLEVPVPWLPFAKQADSDFAVGGWTALVLAAKEIFFFKAQRGDIEKSANMAVP